MTTMNRGEKLRHLRRAVRLSQEEMATRAGVDQAAISLLEAGRRRGTADTWRRIAAALGVPAEWFGVTDK